MEKIVSLGEKNIELAKVIGGSCAAAVVGYIIWKRVTKPSKNEYPKDTVIHHNIGRGFYIPSMTPFAMKLETYLRIANIPYINVHDRKKSKKDKLTWMEYNGEEIDDSEFCIEYLNKKYKIDLSKNFSARERGVARAFQKMLEENTYWAVVLERWWFDDNCTILKYLRLPSFYKYLARRRLYDQAYGQGIGRHSKEEVYHIFNRDMKALSDFLGKNKFILGDSPCQEDCAIFGMLAALYWQGFDSRLLRCLKTYTNLYDYCERMKERFWPDWDECITKGETQKATK